MQRTPAALAGPVVPHPRRQARQLSSPTQLRTVAKMEASSSAPNALAQLLQRVATALPPETQVLVLSHLPMPELARLSCVHKSFHVAWRSLHEHHPGRHYAPPSADDIQKLQGRRRLERAGFLGDVAGIQAMVAAGVDKHGTPLLRARKDNQRVVDVALTVAAIGGHLQAVELLFVGGADVHAGNDMALHFASNFGHPALAQLLIQHGANVHADGDIALRDASREGHADVVRLLIQHGAFACSQR